MSERLVELEVRITYQDELIKDLDEVVRSFANRVEFLERELGQLKASLASQPDPMGPADEPPPHY